MQPPPIDFFLVCSDGRRIRLKPGPCYVLGRGSECEITLADTLASRKHASLTWEDGSFWWLEDLASANGTQINDRRINGRSQLIDGQRIQIGGQTLEYVLLPPGADPGELDARSKHFSDASTIRPVSSPNELMEIGATFTGEIEAGGIPDLLQFLVLTRKSGRLNLFIPNHLLTWVWVRQGRFVDAGFADVRGMDALKQIVQVDTPIRFAFNRSDEPDCNATIAISSDRVLMELVRSLDESRRKD